MNITYDVGTRTYSLTFDGKPVVCGGRAMSGFATKQDASAARQAIHADYQAENPAYGRQVIGVALFCGLLIGFGFLVLVCALI